MRLPINRTKERTCLNGESGAGTAPRQNDQPRHSTRCGYSAPKSNVPLGKPVRGKAGAGRAGRQGLGQAPPLQASPDLNSLENTALTLHHLTSRLGCAGYPDGSGTHIEAGSGSGMSRGPACSGRTRCFPSRIPPASAAMDGRLRGERSAQATHRWVLWVPWHPTDGEADPMLTPAQGPTSPGGSLLIFRPLRTPLPPFPGSPVTPGWRKLGCSVGAQALVSLKQTGRERASSPFPEAASGSQCRVGGRNHSFGDPAGPPQKCLSPAPHRQPSLPLFWGPTPTAGAAALTYVPGGGGICIAAPMPPGGALSVQALTSKTLILSHMCSRFHDTLKIPGRFWDHGFPP